jgi:uncharacterized membrane protein YhiD involved in acid resistance
VLLAAPAAAHAQPAPIESPSTAAPAPSGAFDEPVWRHALIALPLAAVLGAALAFRPARRGTPRRDPAVIQTQIVLAVVGALVMTVVGASLARAFGIAGAASLVRYRAKITDPKDAAVMLTALAVGLAAGVGTYALAAIATVFILVVLWIIESIEPAVNIFELKATGDRVQDLRTGIESILRGHDLRFELRTSSATEVAYEVRLPAETRTDRISRAITALREQDPPAINWDKQ